MGAGRTFFSLFVAGSLAACGGESEPTLQAGTPPETHAESAGTCDRAAEPAPTTVDPQAPSAVLDDGARLFGSALSDRTETALADIAASPSTYEGQTVRTEGTIARVCQRMGCWMELTADGAQPVRVPMAGHSFFLPRDVAGRPATIEGRVLLTPLSPGARAHLASEGAVATADELSIEATGVVVR
jgi:hypothetical protein